MIGSLFRSIHFKSFLIVISVIGCRPTVGTRKNHAAGSHFAIGQKRAGKFQTGRSGGGSPYRWRTGRLFRKVGEYK